MAKLTATFEMKDNISSKLKGLYFSLEKVELMTDASSKAIDRLDKSKARPTLSVIDTASGTVRTIQDNVDQLHKTKARPTITADDQSSAVTDKVQKKMDSLDGSKATTTVTADDQATSVIENIQAKLDALSGTVLTIGAAGGITGASLLGSGSSTMEQNARTSATTGMSYEGVNKYVNDIYYNQKAGNSRDEVALSLQNMSQQTDLYPTILCYV